MTGAQNTLAITKTIKRNILQLLQSIQERGYSVDESQYLAKFDDPGLDKTNCINTKY
jgi:hypothetical protein